MSASKASAAGAPSVATEGTQAPTMHVALHAGVSVVGFGLVSTNSAGKVTLRNTTGRVVNATVRVTGSHTTPASIRR